MDATNLGSCTGKYILYSLQSARVGDRIVTDFSLEGNVQPLAWQKAYLIWHWGSRFESRLCRQDFTSRMSNRFPGLQCTGLWHRMEPENLPWDMSRFDEMVD